jgi:hypothetical protein
LNETGWRFYRDFNGIWLVYTKDQWVGKTMAATGSQKTYKIVLFMMIGFGAS